MTESRRRATGSLLSGLARAVATGSLLGVATSALASCGRSTPGASERDGDTARVAMLQSKGETNTKPNRPDVPMLRGECTECHPRTHDAVLGHGPAASASCAQCHARVHENIHQFYAAIPRRAGVPPDPMFEARVQCAECHADSTFAGVGAARVAALDRACTSCHGPKFAGMLPRWSAGMEWRTRSVSMYVARAVADRRLATTARARARVRFAREALQSVNSAGAVHNVRGADALFRAAIDSAVAAYADAGMAAPARPSLGPDPARITCVGCHYGIESSRGSIFGQAFDHGAHVLRGQVGCRQCHSAADYLLPGTHDLDKRHGRTMLTPASCSGCHHDPASGAACATCHTGDPRLGRAITVTLPLRLRPANAPRSRQVAFEHPAHVNLDCANCHTSRGAVTQVTACATCHERHHTEVSRCTACHGTEVHAAHAAADHLACTRCHTRETVALLTPDRSFCVSCHVDRADHKRGRECSTCHMQSTPPELRKRILGGTP